MKNKIYFLFLILTFSSINLFANKLVDYLIPIPKSLEQHSGIFNRNSGRIIIPSISGNTALIKIAGTLKSLLSEMNIESSIAAGASKDEAPLVLIYLTPALPLQSYRIAIHSGQIILEGGDEAGLFYALQTFKQIVRYAKNLGTLPLVSIEDIPDFKRRGIMLDVSRNKVPTMNTLRNLADLFASWKINEIQLYTESAFAYQNHSTVWEGFSPMTADEILELDQFCRERFIDLVPNQTSFGHMNQWLEHDQFKNLAELTGLNSGHVMSPVQPGTMDLMRELYSELLPNFSSRYFNINCDEVGALGSGRSKEVVDEKGKGRVYLDYLIQLKNEVDKYGRTTQFWGDIILNHPEFIPEIPKDMISLVWGYEADYPFDINCKKFRDAGCTFYVCPGTSSWRSLVGRNQNAFDNLKNAAYNGLKYGAMGFLNTDWGDYGHWQPLPVSYPTYLFGAAISWGLEANENIDAGKLVARYIFDDSSGRSGKALFDLGNAYLKSSDSADFDNPLFHDLLASPGVTLSSGTTKKRLKATIDYLNRNLQLLLNAPLRSEDAEIVKKEMTLAVNMATLSCRIGLARLDISTHGLTEVQKSKRKGLSAEFENLIKEYKTLWVLRNRPGGLHKSAGNLEKGLRELEKN